MKRIILLGSTGSIGLNTLQVVREHPGKFKIVALAARSSADVLSKQIDEFHPEAVCLTDEKAAASLQSRVNGTTRVLAGEKGLREIAAWKTGDMVIAASSGASALVPVLDAIEAGKDIGLANKEILVIAGALVSDAVRARRVRLLPVDSEHNAIYQCVGGAKNREIRRILLTGSGGPLKDVPRERFRGISKDIVTRHPRWSMGKKITVDSATLMNKGLEIIEAQWLFGVEPERIRVVIHPEAIVHSMVEFVDGSILAQMGPTDMKSPLLHVMSHPERYDAPASSIDLVRLGALHFSEPDFGKFPCLGLALEAARASRTTLPCVLSAADEVAVEAFLEDRIDFVRIPEVIEAVMRSHTVKKDPALKDIQEADRWARAEASRLSGVPAAAGSRL